MAEAVRLYAMLAPVQIATWGRSSVVHEASSWVFCRADAAGVVGGRWRLFGGGVGNGSYFSPVGLAEFKQMRAPTHEKLGSRLYLLPKKSITTHLTGHYIYADDITILSLMTYYKPIL